MCLDDPSMFCILELLRGASKYSTLARVDFKKFYSSMTVRGESSARCEKSSLEDDS